MHETSVGARHQAAIATRLLAAAPKWLADYWVQWGLALVVWLPWLWAVQRFDYWEQVAQDGVMSLTMLFGSFIAGATSEGGGAVAFPVMTLLFKIPPATARDFALMIQTVGMGAAAITIFACGVPTCRRTLLWAGLGGACGVVFGLEFVAHGLPPAFIKMFFTSLWLSFAAVLVWLNRDSRRLLFSGVPDSVNARYALVGVGFLGGVVSAITGSGVDILTFSLIVLTFRISEAVATPTSVVLMALIAAVGFAYRGIQPEPIAERAWDFWRACVPIVVVGAPLGASFIKGRSRGLICGLLTTCIVCQFVGALFVLPLSAPLLLSGGVTLGAGVGLFVMMKRAAERATSGVPMTARASE